MRFSPCCDFSPATGKVTGLFIGAAGIWRRQEKARRECERAELFGRAQREQARARSYGSD